MAVSSGIVVAIVSTKIAASPDPGTRATRKHNESIKFGKKIDMSETEYISKHRKPLARGTCKQDQAYTAKKRALEVQLNSCPEKSKTNQV